MALIRSSGSLLMVVKSELEGVPGSGGGGGDNDINAFPFPTPSPSLPPPPPANSSTFLPRLSRLSITKPSWIVRSESNVWREEIKRPSPPCVICQGAGRVDCFHCQGKGRTNCVDQAMLPKGEWPKWCKSCGGSGLGYCSRCLGSGKYTEVMGFRLRRSDDDNSGGRNRKKSS